MRRRGRAPGDPAATSIGWFRRRRRGDRSTTDGPARPARWLRRVGRPSDPTLAATGHPSPLARRVRRTLVVVGALAVGATAAVVALGLTPPTRGDVGPGTVELRARWALDGGTDLEVPPLGTVSAPTHGAPLDLRADVEEIDFDQLQALVEADEPTQALYEQAESDLRALVREFTVKTLIAAAVAGAIAGALVSRVRLVPTGLGSFGGLLGVGILLLVTWSGFDARAFDQPQFVGPIEQAPGVLDTARRQFGRLGDIRERVAVIAAEISDLYATAASDRPLRGSAGEVRILHVSDLHLNPLGIQVAGELAASFDVDAILDTGDLTSFGHPLEAEIGNEIAQIPFRWILVPGNHDSDENRAALAELPNVELLDDTMVEVAGVDIFGAADPTFTADNRTSNEEATAVKERAARRVARLTRRHRPDVLAVHDPRLGWLADGYTPLVVAGHVHERHLRHRDGTIHLTVGSTGATGLGTFTVETDAPYEAQILRFRRGCLVALDYIRVDGIGGSFEVDRRSFDLEPAGTARSPRCETRDAPSTGDGQWLPGSNSSAAELMQ